MPATYSSKLLAEAQRYTGQTVLVTGGTGYIGSALIGALAVHAARIVRISRTPQAPLNGVIDVVANLNDPDGWHWVNEADVLFHLAGKTSIAATAADPLGSFYSNVTPVIHAIEATLKSPRRPALVIAGTVTQVGMVEELPVKTDASDNPVTVYDLHKLMAEKHLNLAVSEHGIRGCCLRLANVYGPSKASTSKASRGTINKLVGMALEGQPLTIYGHGNYLRDYIYIDDVVSAFLSAGATKTAQNGNGWIISTGIGTTIHDAFGLIAERATAATGTTVPIKHAQWPEGTSKIDLRNFIGDSSTFSEATGWSAQVSLEEGIDRTIARFQASK